MLKKAGVFAMMLASLGAVLPATAVAAERGREVKTVVVQQRDVRGRKHHPKVIVKQAQFVRRGDVRK